jgi:hypothetical protein
MTHQTKVSVENLNNNVGRQVTLCGWLIIPNKPE